MTATELRAQWEGDSSFRKEWEVFCRSKTWQILSAMVEAEAVEAAQHYSPYDAETILARNLVKMKSAIGMLDTLRIEAVPPPPPAADPEPYDKAYMKKIQKEKEQNR